MRKTSTKEAARRFFSVLKDADDAPVVIERHGRPRAAVVSYRRFQLYEKLIKRFSEEVALDLYNEAIEKTGAGRLGLGAKALKDARFFAKMAGLGGAK